MKKLGILILGLFLFPVVASAAVAPAVDTVTATIDGTTIKYSGTTVGESTAVMCKLVDANGEVIDEFSSAVDEDKFSGEFVTTTNGNYEVRCANYEGGEVKGATVTVDSATNPATGDKIYTYGIILGVALVGVGIVVVIMTKKNKKK